MPPAAERRDAQGEARPSVPRSPEAITASASLSRISLVKRRQPEAANEEVGGGRRVGGAGLVGARAAGSSVESGDRAVVERPEC